MEFSIVLPENKNDICRFCLNINENFNNNLYVQDEPTKLHELLSIINVEISHNEYMPNNICNNCEQQLQAFCTFKYMILDNEKILRCIYEKNDTENRDEEVKEEYKENLEICDNEVNVDDFDDAKVSDEIEVKKKNLRQKSIGKSVSRNKASICNTCGKSFRSDYLKKHLIKCKGFKTDNNIDLNNTPKDHICSVCHEECVDELRLVLHYIQHFLYEETEKMDPVFFCNYCGFVLANSEEYVPHLLERHEGEFLQDKWPCKYCEAIFPTEFELMSHEHMTQLCKKIKSESEQGTCLICKKEYEGSLSNHLKRHLLKRHTCLKCKEKYIILLAHNYHLQTHPEYKFKCGYCSRRFVFKSNMDKHIKEMHHNEKYICEICSKIFNRRNNLESHIKQKHDEKSKKTVCAICGYSTVSKHDLKRHEKFHTNEKPFKCNYEGCTKAYKTSSHLSHHKKTHLNLRSYTCEICDKAFYTSNHLKDHMYIHTGERNYICEVCHHSFKRKDQLQAHKKIHKPREECEAK